MKATRWVARRATARAVAAVFTVAAVGSTLGGCGVVPGPDTPVTVVVGVDLDLTGRGQDLAYDDALRLAVAQVNERQLAGLDRRVELRVLDNRGDATLSAQNLSTLTTDPEVSVVVTAGCTQCVIDMSGSLSVPVIVLSGEEAVAAPAAERRWVFRLGPNAADNADVLSVAMADNDVDTVGVIAADDRYGRDGVRWFGSAAQRSDIEVTETVHLPAVAGDAELAAAAATILGIPPGSTVDDADDVPDAVLLWTYAPQAGQIAQALRTAGYEGDIYADMVAANDLFEPGPGLVGARLVATSTAVAAERVAASPAAAARQEWVLSYVSRFGSYQMQSTWVADALLVIADAIARADGTDPGEVRTRIESARIDGITGPVRFTAEQHSGLLASALVILTATADRWQ